jgi:hypothetical protein
MTSKNLRSETFDPDALGRRRRREYHTLLAMIEIYCRDKHGQGRGKSGLCADCRELRDYAIERLAKCVFAEKKPPCGKCPVHCYKPDMRVKIAATMRFAGPKMLLRHPYWALRHLLDGLAAKPKMPNRGAKRQKQGPGDR